jgi:exopolysaccharide production protein ExoQ
MKFIGTRLEALFSIFAITAFAGIFWPPNSYWTTPTMPLDASDPYSASLSGVLIVFLIVAGFARRDAVRPLMRPAWPILAMLGLAFVSAFWSDDPALVLRRSITLSGTTLFGVYLVTRFDMAQLVATLVKICVFAAVVSFVVMAVAPAKYGLQGGVDYPTAWKGVYTSKNTLGLMCAIGTIAAVFALRHGYGSRWLAAALIPANLVLLRMSEAGTPLVLLVVTLYAALVFAAFRQRNGMGLAAGFVLVLIGFVGIGLIALDWTEVLAALNRSPTLTGRYRIWVESIDFIARRPWLGYGYGAFWRHDGLEANQFWDIMKWLVPHAHNGWLEVGLGLGIVGMAGITFLFLDGFYRGLKILTVPQARHAVLLLTIFVAILVENQTENEIFRPNGFLWVLFVTAFVAAGRDALLYRAAAPPARRPVAPLALPAARAAR